MEKAIAAEEQAAIAKYAGLPPEYWSEPERGWLRSLDWQDWTALAFWLVLAAIFTPYEIAHTGWWLHWMQIAGGTLAAALLPVAPALLMWMVLKAK